MRSTIFTSRSPKLDLHGEKPETLPYIVNDFINYNIILKNEYVAIVHGKGSGVVKNKVWEILKDHPKVYDYKLNNWNTGETIVHLNIN